MARVKMESQAVEIAQGERFEFGKNWSLFLAVLDDDEFIFVKEKEEACRASANSSGSQHES